MRNRAFASWKRLIVFACAGLTAFVCGAFALATAAPSVNPTLISVSAGSTRAVALESVSMRSEPFSLSSAGNFSPNDPRTRITLFVMNLELLVGETHNSLTADAEDAAQEGFVKAYRAFESLEDAGRARAWLYQIASRTALDELRRRRIVRFIPWTGESRGADRSAEESAMHGRLSAELERGLDAIPERQRSALILAEVHDLTGIELATALGVSHVAARALLTRGRESLRQALAIERARATEHEAAGRQNERREDDR